MMTSFVKGGRISVGFNHSRDETAPGFGAIKGRFIPFRTIKVHSDIEYLSRGTFKVKFSGLGS